MILLLLPGARLPTARVVSLRAVATPLNRCRALRARPRHVHTVFSEGAARLAPLRVRTDHVDHDNHATPPYFRVSRSNPGATMNLGGSGSTLAASADISSRPRGLSGTVKRRAGGRRLHQDDDGDHRDVQVKQPRPAGSPSSRA